MLELAHPEPLVNIGSLGAILVPIGNSIWNRDFLCSAQFIILRLDSLIKFCFCILFSRGRSNKKYHIEREGSSSLCMTLMLNFMKNLKAKSIYSFLNSIHPQFIRTLKNCYICHLNFSIPWRKELKRKNTLLDPKHTVFLEYRLQKMNINESAFHI